MEKSCYECRYFECSSLCCQKLWRTYYVLNGERLAKNCNDYVKGNYNPDLIEKEYWEGK